MKIMRRVRAVCAALMALCLIAAPLCARADLTARFIDVGQGDSCLITCDGESMIVDGGTADNSSKLVALMNALDVDELKYMVNTHPHDDHVGGLCGPLNKVRVDAAYSSTLDYDQNYFISYKRYAQKQGVSLGTLSAGDTLKLGGADVYVLAPIGDTADISDLNDTSIILRVVYGRTSMLLTGDAGLGEEQTLIDSGAELKSDLLKVGHHGAATSSGAEFLQEVSPQWAVISVGVDNDFGHPADETLKRLSSAGANVLRTDKNGTITVNSDGKTITLTAERNFKSITADEPVGETYIGNKNTKKFHRQSCHTLPAEKNRVELKSRDEAIKQGYVPCKNCNP